MWYADHAEATQSAEDVTGFHIAVKRRSLNLNEYPVALVRHHDTGSVQESFAHLYPQLAGNYSPATGPNALPAVMLECPAESREKAYFFRRLNEVIPNVIMDN